MGTESLLCGRNVYLDSYLVGVPFWAFRTPFKNGAHGFRRFPQLADSRPRWEGSPSHLFRDRNKLDESPSPTYLALRCWTYVGPVKADSVGARLAAAKRASRILSR